MSLELNNFSSLFELLAGLTLAYAGIESFRQQLFFVITDYLTPRDAKKKFIKTVSEATALLEDTKKRKNDEIINPAKPSTQEDHTKQTLLKLLKDALVKKESDIDLADTNFLAEGSHYRAGFFISFLFCFLVLILMGFVKFLPEECIHLTLQILSLSGFYILFIFIIPNGIAFHRVLCKLWIQLVWYLALVIATVILNAFPEVRFSLEMPLSCLVIWCIFVACLPFIADLIRVQRYALSRNSKVKIATDNITGRIETVSEFVKASIDKISPSLNEAVNKSGIVVETGRDLGDMPPPDEKSVPES